MQSTIKTHYTAQEKAPAAIRNEAMHKEINSNKVDIDRSCFQKTPEEKTALKKAKSFYKTLNK